MTSAQSGAARRGRVLPPACPVLPGVGLDGSTDGLWLDGPPVSADATSLTFSAWIRPQTDDPAIQRVYRDEEFPDDGVTSAHNSIFTLNLLGDGAVTAGQVLLSVDTEDGDFFGLDPFALPIIPVGRWSHVLVSFATGDTSRIWVDGVLQYEDLCPAGTIRATAVDQALIGCGIYLPPWYTGFENKLEADLAEVWMGYGLQVTTPGVFWNEGCYRHHGDDGAAWTGQVPEVYLGGPAHMWRDGRANRGLYGAFSPIPGSAGLGDA